MASAIEYLVPRMKKWGIPMSMVVTHQQVAPTRKTDISPRRCGQISQQTKGSTQLMALSDNVIRDGDQGFLGFASRP
jgi:hypothetical protein